MKRTHAIAFYLGYVLVWAVTTVAAATLAGALLFPIIGKLFGSMLGIGELALHGARNMAEWTAKVWALSLGIVMAFRHAHHHRATHRVAEQDR